jgi:dUTP pyrophosphatase
MTLRFSRLTADAVLPFRKHPADAGVDIFASESVLIPSFSYRVVHTGVTFEVPEGTMLEIRPKGRNNHLIGAGVVDAGYQGEILVKVVNFSWKPLRIRKGDAIAQLVQLPVICEPLEELPVERLHGQPSERGNEGGIYQR